MKKEVYGLKGVEYILAVIVSVLIILTLLSRNFIYISYIITSLLILTFILVRAAGIIKKRGTHIWDYLSLAIIVIFGVIFTMLKGEVNAVITIFISLFLLYSSGVFPTTDRILKAKTVTAFAISYGLIVLTITFMFAGIFMLNPGEFVDVTGSPTSVSFEQAIFISIVSYTSLGADIFPIGINRLFMSIEMIISTVVNVGFIGYILGHMKR